MYIGMPDVKVYIRQENLEKWNTIANKSEWVNTLLSNSSDTSQYGATRQTPVGPAVTVLQETTPTSIVQRAGKIVSPPRLGMACCKLAAPCRHWLFNGEDAVWENVLTGETREV